MHEEYFIECQILKILEESIIEEIIGALHRKMMAMLRPQYIISPHEPNDFVDEDSFSGYSQSSSSLYDFDEVRSQPMSFTHDTFNFQCDY